MNLSVSVEGVDDLEKALQEASRKFRRAFNKAVEATTEDIRDEARNLVPQASGDLHDAIGARSMGPSGEVGIFDDDIYYGPFVEWGTSKQPAQPFMTPAAELGRDRFVRRIEDAGGDAA